MVARALADLDAAQQVQEVNVATLPQETLGVYETKGRLLREGVAFFLTLHSLPPLPFRPMIGDNQSVRSAIAASPA
jgi:hypothetical protein